MNHLNFLGAGSGQPHHDKNQTPDPLVESGYCASLVVADDSEHSTVEVEVTHDHLTD